jgi:hypothetical protein
MMMAITTIIIIVPTSVVGVRSLVQQKGRQLDLVTAPIGRGDHHDTHLQRSVAQLVGDI